MVIYSSNIGIAKISDIIGKEKTYDSFREFGLDHLVVGINENDINLTLEWIDLIGAYLSEHN